MATKKLSLKQSPKADRRRSERLARARGGPSALGPRTLDVKPGGKRRVRARMDKLQALTPRRRRRPVPPDPRPGSEASGRAGSRI